MEMLILVVFAAIGYLVAVEIVAQAGDKRECGYWKAGLIALFLSPVFGMLYVLSSKRRSESMVKFVRGDEMVDQLRNRLGEVLEEKSRENRAKEEEINGLTYGKFEPGKVDSITPKMSFHERGKKQE